ncbi:MAG: ptp [Paucimonas sp.]|nr:ptp [Paucimonas sp.]
MAEGLFARALPGRLVCSAGLHALVGEGADPIAIELMQQRGIDISQHRAQQLASWMVREADLIVTMDSEQKHYIDSTWVAARGKVRRLCEAGGIDIPDPYRHGEHAFAHALGLIEEGMDHLVSWVARQEVPRPAPVEAVLRKHAGLRMPP